MSERSEGEGTGETRPARDVPGRTHTPHGMRRRLRSRLFFFPHGKPCFCHIVRLPCLSPVPRHVEAGSIRTYVQARGMPPPPALSPHYLPPIRAPLRRQGGG